MEREREREREVESERKSKQERDWRNVSPFWLHQSHNNVLKLMKFFFFFLFRQVPDSNHTCRSELWSILVVSLAHSADPRSRLCVYSAPNEAYIQHVLFLCGHPSRYELRLTVLSFGDLTGIGVSPPLGRRKVMHFSQFFSCLLPFVLNLK